MNVARTEFLENSLGAFLLRASPPRHIAGNPQAMADEAASLGRVVNQRAPSQGYSDWWAKFADELQRRMKTRAWPIVSEIEAAAAAVAAQSRQSSEPDQDLIEGEAIKRMASWFEKFKSQLPSHGRSSRTAALIAQGVLQNEREARFYGFDLSDEQRRKSDDQAPSRAEEQHDRRVMADLRAISERHAATRDEVIRNRAAMDAKKNEDAA
jgi:hypothetical protein